VIFTIAFCTIFMGLTNTFMFAQSLPDDELLYFIALTMVPSVGDVHARELLMRFQSAKTIFHTRLHHLEKTPGIGKLRARRIKSFRDFNRAELELRFANKYHIHAITINDEAYPVRLKNCYDAPILLYFRGNGNLNVPRVINVIGTRSNSEYGKDIVRKFLEELMSYKVLVVSGLAYGIDALAHKTALKLGLETVGVLAHGLDRIYPPAHRALAMEIVEQGGLLTDFMSGDEPDKQNFPKRNRIVAGMTDATIVVETGIKGGSMITAELANGYNKDVFAFPGRVNDAKSEGCHHLIKTNKAALITSAKDLVDAMNWEERKSVSKIQTRLFPELSADEKVIIKILTQKETVHIDEIHAQSNLKSSAVAAAILNLELQGLINGMPGKMYKLIG